MLQRRVAANPSRGVMSWGSRCRCRAHEPSSAPTAVAKNQSTVTHLRGLLAVTSLVRGEDDLDAVLEAIARTIAECLGFGTVAINLYRPAWDDFQVTNVYGNPGAREALLGDARDLASWQPLLDERFLRRGAYLIPHEHVGWKLGDETLSAQMTLGDVAPLLDPEFEVEGCFLLPNDQARRRFSADVFVYRSKLNGRGPWAWNRHWLVVPLVDRDGATIGVIWADEPEDRLLPPRERLQALRLFANQAATAVALVDHVQELRFLADHDPLTRLLNRRVFMERLDSEAARADRSGRPFGLVLCDLDRFKLLNDSKGHLAGDEALRRLGRILVESLRRSDEAFRIGGDEFALVLPDTSPEAVRSVVERVAAAMEQAPEGALDGVRASFGAAAYPDDAGHPEALVHAADEALYEAKRAGEQLRFAA